MESSLVHTLAERFMNLHSTASGLFNEKGICILRNEALSDLFALVHLEQLEEPHADALELISSNFKKVLLWEELVERAQTDDFNLGVTLGIWPGHYFKCSLAKLVEGDNNFYLLQLVDITPQKALERKLAERNSILEKIINEFPQMIVALDDAGHIKVWNQRCREVLGYMPAQMIDNPRALAMLLPAHGQLGDVLSKWNDRSENIIRHWEMEVACADGSIRVISWTVRYRETPIVEGLHHWAVGVDVTKQRVAEDAVRRSEERFNLICKTTNDAVWDWDLLKDELWWSDGLTKIFGHETRHLENNIDWWVSNLHPSQRDAVYDGFKKAVESGEAYWSDEYLFRKKDGSYTLVLDRGYLLKDAAGKPIRMTGGMIEQPKERVVELAATEFNAERKAILSDIVLKM